MKKLIQLCLSSLMVMACAAPVTAETTGQITVGGDFYSNDWKNAKLNEYRLRHTTQGGGFGEIRIESDSENHSTGFDLRYLSPQDVDLGLRAVGYGKYRFDFGFQRMGHNFAFDSKTIYNTSTSTRLTIDPAVKAPIAASLTSAALAANLTAAVNTGRRIDLFLSRDRVNAGLNFKVFGPLSVGLFADYEHRDGTRPYGGTFGFGNSIELPEPIDYDTLNARAQAEITAGPVYVNASMFHSTFDNKNQSFQYENPFRTVDSTTATAYLQTTAAGPVFGRNSLAPSNYNDSANVLAAVNLPLASRITVNANYGWMRQDETLLAPTDNTALIPALANPRDKADAKVDTESLEASFSTNPVDWTHLKVGAKYYRHKNRTPVADFAHIIADATDETLTVGPDTPDYVSWISRSAYGEAVFRVAQRSDIGFQYDYESESYRSGSAFRERINTGKVFFDTRPTGWMSSRVTLEYSQRRSRYPDYPAEEEIKWLRKFYAADRNRYAASVNATFTPVDPLSVSLDYMYGMDRYPRSLFGLRNGTSHTATADVSYQMTNAVSLYSFYTFEWDRTNQRDRQWTPLGIGDPSVAAFGDKNGFSNWFVKNSERSHTVGIGAKAGAIKNLLDIDVSGTYSHIYGRADFASGVGTVLNDSNPFVPVDFASIDNSELWKLSGKFMFNLSKAFGITLGYAYEKWKPVDYDYDGLTQVPVTGTGNYNGLLNLNTLYKPYEAHIATVAATYRF
ncbi:MAG TPA: MtrB/PioB family outer membrane beta-barrel protein [Nitrospirota bacterium]